ncbi:conserved hypothetical protein [Desulfamplus magnetovallimortis]|uniref:Uncharacterized protein n=1 Tax=Desulfamplus magnetovallimortis TaxID=1246637 RepID=A0A1W1HH74_9BACT|nr:hypothetical protein [Desulfamplus magnetovallimortis]SLM31796.1 conserved hypothetical protein [Desulfamplus magnetovallimortis]
MFSRKEEEWYKKFQEGTFGVKGWKGRSKEILKPFSSDEKMNLKDKLDNLGEKIGREWAKDNSVRKIDTPMLQGWGKELLAAKDKGAETLIQEIDRLENEVNRIL